MYFPFAGELEADESYFGPRPVRGRRGRGGGGGKTIVFGLLIRDDQVYTEIVPKALKAALQTIMRGKAKMQSVLHTGRWRGYESLVDRGFDNISGSLMATTNSRWGQTTSPAWRAFGATPNTAWRSSMK